MNHPTDAAIAQANELMACPFCGGADLEVFGDRPNEAMLGGFNVCCRNPGCQATCRHSGDRAKAIRAWNRRTPAREPGAAKPEQVHTCSYYCDRPECLKAQRDELRDRLEATPPAQAAESVQVASNPGAILSKDAEAVAWRSKNFDPLMSGGFAWSFTTDPGSVTARHEGLYVNVAADAIAAARYRWLRDYAGIIEESGPLVFHADKDARPGTPIDGRLLDAAIDAAIAAMQAGVID